MVLTMHDLFLNEAYNAYENYWITANNELTSPFNLDNQSTLSAYSSSDIANAAVVVWMMLADALLQLRDLQQCYCAWRDGFKSSNCIIIYSTRK